MSAKKYLKMPVVIQPPPAEKTEKEEQLWVALKKHILRERERKKQELEAEVEEERLRKEREAREKQDVMTLGETRDQISMLDKKLQELRNEKQQLFLQLKKVLNEDERKRQMHEKMFTIQDPQQQMFIPQRGVPPHSQHLIPKGNSQANVAKRTRSPSPPQQMPGYYKHPNHAQPYHQPPKIEEGRRGGEVARAVLWNKQPQYHTPGTLFFPSSNPQNVPDSRAQPIIYPNYQGNINLPIRQNYHVDMSQQPSSQSKQEIVNKNPQPPPGTVYHINLDQSGMPPQQNQGPPPQQMKQHSQGQPITIEKIQERPAYHLELKHDDRKDIRSAQPQSQQPPSHMYTTALRAGQMPINPAMAAAAAAAAANQQIPKSGSITQGYPPVRPSNPQQPPTQIHYRHPHRY